MMKWPTKLAIKRKAKGKRRERDKIEIDSQKKVQSKVQILAYAHMRKTKKLLNYVQ